MIEILEQTPGLVVCIKPVGVRAQGEAEADLPALLKRQLGCEIYPVHRLDQAVGGVMVFAKTGAPWRRSFQRRFRRENSKRNIWLCSRSGRRRIPGNFTICCSTTRFKNKTFVVSKERKGVKKASLSYRVLAESNGRCLVHVRLYTGRTHQIRVQFASRGCPLVGDGKYGSRVNAASPALWSYALTLPGVGGKEERFCALPEMQGAWEPFSDALSRLDTLI